jgi:hypothetical protein
VVKANETKYMDKDSAAFVEIADQQFGGILYPTPRRGGT